jgi:hypothetical protein
MEGEIREEGEAEKSGNKQSRRTKSGRDPFQV